jgi:hypothetical protein
MFNVSASMPRRENMKKLVLPLGAAIALSMFALSPAGAFTMTQKCVIANELCFVSRASAAGFTPEQRIDRVNERLAYILGYENLRPGNIRMVSVGPDVQIRVGRSLLVTVTRADARANGARRPESLARIWLRNLRDAMPQARPLPRVASTGSATRVASSR